MGIEPVGGGHSALYPWDETGGSGMGGRHWASHPLRNGGMWVSRMGGGPGRCAHGTLMRCGQRGPVRGRCRGRHTCEADGRGVVVGKRRAGVSVQVVHWW